jgi:hypothetical protein
MVQTTLAELKVLGSSFGAEENGSVYVGHSISI